MSLRKGETQRSRPQKHQNTYTYKHNKNSKLTKKIEEIQHEGLCKRCDEKIEWRKKYRKYKPLTNPGACNQCHQRNVLRAYHTLCKNCAEVRGVCAWCCTVLEKEPMEEVEGEEDEGEGEEEEEDDDFSDLDD